MRKLLYSCNVEGIKVHNDLFSPKNFICSKSGFNRSLSRFDGSPFFRSSAAINFMAEINFQTYTLSENADN